MAELLDRLSRALAGRYDLERVLGQGGAAVVYLARDLKHDRPVAVKVLRPELADLLGGERFLREIRIAANLNHPHVVPLYDSGTADGLLYYVMPYIEGETLRQRLRRPPPMPVGEAIDVVCGVAAALSHAHGRGVIHRDVKPENIMLSGGAALVTDFGIARAIRAAAPEALTGTGLSLGTLGYMSPEQAAGSAELDERSDVYSLGCVLYELVLGQPPRRWLRPGAVREGRITDAPADERRRLAGLPVGIESILVRALAPLPEQRFDSAVQFAEALRAGRPVAALCDPHSIAVLPFVNLGGDPESEYLGDGIAEEITTALAKLHALRVAARTSAFAFKGKDIDVRRMGAELGVATVLEGSVRRAGDALRVTVQLVNVADGYQLWSERFDGPMEDVFAIQDEIARNVVDAMQLILSEDERRAIAHPPPIDIKAYDFYLRGRQFFRQNRKKSLQYARQMFQRAIDIDPTYALAWAGVADSCSVLHMYYPSSADDLAHADRASLRALELGPRLPEAHAARGFALFQMKRHEEATQEFQTALRLDPSQFEARYFQARSCFQRGRLAEAARWFEEAASVREDYSARFFAAQSYAALGREEDARAAYRRALTVVEQYLEINPDDPRAATMCAVSLCRLGDPARGLEWAERALSIDPEDAGVRYNVACLYALEGQREQAIDCLEEVIRLGFGNLEWIGQDPDLDSLREHPRFRRLMTSLAPPA
jgi:TolB-like protein/Flp pilus assembly protein TadD/tRNA A-37 threonylcarbamoyl transferase component Bud32